MEHPRMYDDAEPLLARLRPLALAFPESAEVEARGRPTFRAGRGIFAVHGANHEHPSALFVTPDADGRPALLGDDRFHAPPCFGPGGWLALDLDDPGVDRSQVRELLDSSYRQVALVRMVRALDADGSVRTPQAAPAAPTDREVRR